jgi:hypothetical protein
MRIYASVYPAPTLGLIVAMAWPVLSQSTDHCSPKIKTTFARRGLTQAPDITLSCSCYLLKWCRVAQVAIPKGENSNFAKQSQFAFGQTEPA